MIPDIGISNGVMSVILNYAKAMPDDIKFDIVYFSQKEKTRQADIESLGGRVYKIDAPSPKDLLTGKMNGFFAEHKNEWQALHIHCPHFALFIAPYAKRAGIKKVAVHCHTTTYSLKGNGKRNQLLSLYAKYFIKDKFACSNAAGKMWYGSKSFSVLNNAVDCEKLSYNKSARDDVRKRENLENKFVVSHIGRTDVVQKNHPFILKVFAELKKKRDDAQLILIGGEENADLTLLCKSLGIADSVSFLGIRWDIPELLQAADVFLFPSTSEGLPVSVVEAQSAGLSVLMSDAVPNEVAVSDLVTIMSLDEDAQKWADKLISISERERQNTLQTMKQNGWDIFECASNLAEYYKK